VAKGRVSIVVERYKACRFCVEFCPTKVLALSSAFNSKGFHPPHVVAPEKCSGCDLCGMYCPDVAICGQRIRSPKVADTKWWNASPRESPWRAGPSFRWKMNSLRQSRCRARRGVGQKPSRSLLDAAFSLMMEHIGYAAMTETPCVFVDV
jgi:2-oxoglutarate ferredoxin oxidoreductase subunit delta